MEFKYIGTIYCQTLNNNLRKLEFINVVFFSVSCTKAHTLLLFITL